MKDLKISLFHLQVRNEQCMKTFGENSYSYPETTKHFEWKNDTVCHQTTEYSPIQLIV